VFDSSNAFMDIHISLTMAHGSSPQLETKRSKSDHINSCRRRFIHRLITLTDNSPLISLSHEHTTIASNCKCQCSCLQLLCSKVATPSTNSQLRVHFFDLIARALVASPKFLLHLLHLPHVLLYHRPMLLVGVRVM